jgi:hypothetical protein
MQIAWISFTISVSLILFAKTELASNSPTIQWSIYTFLGRMLPNPFDQSLRVPLRVFQLGEIADTRHNLQSKTATEGFWAYKGVVRRVLTVSSSVGGNIANFIAGSLVWLVYLVHYNTLALGMRIVLI